MFSRVYTGGIAGVDAYRIDVEVDCGGGMGQIHIVGLPDAAVKESQERVRSAIKACEFLMPPGKKWIVNLAPADLRKEGPSFDLPIAIGILSATGYVPIDRLGEFWMVGELGLDGTVRGTQGVLPVAMSCREQGFTSIIVPDANCEEAELIEGLSIYPVSHLRQVLDILAAQKSKVRLSNARTTFAQAQRVVPDAPDFADVKGQLSAKRALMIAAAGRHNVLMVGAPGSGKSMLAQRLPGIMPPLEFDEALELTKLYSVVGLLAQKGGVIAERPFRAPHHSATVTGLVGGGTWPRPGEISLSHHGVLFLDELTEFPRHHLDALRQPMEAGVVTISRAHQTLSYPASFLMIGACNPCPCGYRGDHLKFCICTGYQADRYWSRLSGPFLDRIDLHIHCARLNETELARHGGDMTSEEMRMQIMRAVDMQRQRSSDPFRFRHNGQLGARELRKVCDIGASSRELLAKAVTQLGLSARAYDRVLRISRTIADLESSEFIETKHIAEALGYRNNRVLGH